MELILYHGSNLEVKVPRIIHSDRRLDFGYGFYLTSDLNQATRWAQLTTERKHEGTPCVTAYRINASQLCSLNLIQFNAPNAKWLKYVAMNRRGIAKAEIADVVIGPVANDQTSPVIFMFLSGELSVSEAIRRLKPQQLKNQYAFRTDKSIALLKYKETLRI